MILVLTFKEYEQGTDPVVDWLLFYKVNFVKIFIEDLLTSSKGYRVDVNNKSIYVDGEEITSKINVVFYRRFNKNIRFPVSGCPSGINKKIERESNGELEDLYNYMFFILKDKVWFPHFSRINVNKLETLNLAREAGLQIPYSVVTNSKKELAELKDNIGSLIYKPIRQVSYYCFGEYTYSPYTTEINTAEIEKLNDFFFPSLFQEKIPFLYEIRCFYLDGEIYASAIMTEADRKVDIKLSFNSKETKWVNYLLPNNIKNKLRCFMESINLNTGSIDLIKSLGGQYYFIEVNPVGQYFAPSVRCNYYLEKKIAEWLIKQDINECKE